MLLSSIIIFAIAAIFGFLTILKVLTGKPTQKPVVFLHGLFAATALVLLLAFSFVATKTPTLSIILFVIAALGGFALFFRDLLKKPGPKSLAIIHAIAAVVAFLMLLAFYFTR